MLVPYPASLQIAVPAYLELGATPAIILAGSPADQAVLRPGAVLLGSELNVVTDGAVAPAVTLGVAASPGAGATSITLALDSRLADETYELVITRGGVTLTAGTYAGIVAGTITLVQAAELTGDVDAVPTTVANWYSWLGLDFNRFARVLQWRAAPPTPTHAAGTTMPVLMAACIVC